MNYKFQGYIKKQESDFLNSKVNSNDLIRISDAQNYLNNYNKHLTLQGVSKRTSLTWKIIALFGVGYMLVDLIRYVC